jgi:hypothetical protein
MELGYQEPIQLLLAQLHPIQFFRELFALLASRTGNIGINLVGCFHFSVIDEIQVTMNGFSLFGNNRPFFTPLVHHSKMLSTFPEFMMAGTGMNLKYLTEFVQSSTFKESVMTHQLISCLEPLNSSQIDDY